MDDWPDFEGRYTAEVLSELPSDDERRYYYPGGSIRGGKDGTIVTVTTDGGSWVGIFEFGGHSERLLSGVWGHPNPSTVFVVSRSRGYYVNAEHPEEWGEPDAYPIMEVVPVVPMRMLLLVDLDRITAHGEVGLLWQTRKISWDGLKIVDVGPTTLNGLAHDPMAMRPVPFSVDLITGVATGGSTPDDYR